MNIEDFMDRLADRFGSVGLVAFVFLCVICGLITAMTFVYLVAKVSLLFSALPFIAVAWMIRVVKGPAGNTVADCRYKNGNQDARLIAAAPDLLEALEALVAGNEEWNRSVEAVTGSPAGWTDTYLDAARAAIAKAKGGAA